MLEALADAREMTDMVAQSFRLEDGGGGDGDDDDKNENMEDMDADDADDDTGDGAEEEEKKEKEVGDNEKEMPKNEKEEEEEKKVSEEDAAAAKALVAAAREAVNQTEEGADASDASASASADDKVNADDQKKDDNDKAKQATGPTKPAPLHDDRRAMLHPPPQGQQYRPRILAMHGAQSNDEVTRMQLEHLGITQEEYDIVYLRGGVEVEEGHEDIVGLVRGPYYSWFAREDGTGAMGRSVVEAVRDVLRVVTYCGPFDGCYAFSSGAAVAALASGIAKDPSLMEAVRDLEDASKGDGVASRLYGRVKGTSPAVFAHRLINAVGRRNSVRSVALLNEEAGSLEGGDLVESPFKFVVLACSASPMKSVSHLRETSKLRQVHLPPGSIHVHSFHLVGVDDPMKDQSEEFTHLFSQRHIKYMAGGHGVGHEVKADQDLIDSLSAFINFLGNPPPKIADINFTPMSAVSQLAVLPDSQVGLVKLVDSRLPWRSPEGATILSMLKEQPRDRPFLHVSRIADEYAHTTYGDVVDFIQGGKGDLRKIGVQPGEVVAYGAPPGGGAVPIAAFLSIASQTAAAPLAPSTTKSEALDALDQYNAKHMVLFEGVDCPGIKEAFEEYSQTGKAKLHVAVIAGDASPGIFSFRSEATNGGEDSLKTPPLQNPSSGICLLLRTSGTTARPKAVPLRQDALVVNGSIIAASMGLKDTDVVYSIMPAFHIGSISASILCTLASGGAICCDGEPFNPEGMVKALALSRPQPTWYSAVPTIHNSTVSFLKDVAALDPRYARMGIDANGIWKKGHSLRMIRSGAAALLGPDGKALAEAYGGVPVYPTYSMSEQMPISQPPLGRGNILVEKPGSVGVPVAASIAVVSRSTLRPLPFGEEGEIAISGPTVLEEYFQNNDANRKSYFELTLNIAAGDVIGDCARGGRYFLTGDVGVLEKDGFLYLKGRAKELIKKGGEQISPFEIEDPLLNHPWIQTPVCFSIPSRLYGEEVGCALVLSPDAPTSINLQDITIMMRTFLKKANIATFKWPSKWAIVKEEDLPRTKTKKVMRIGLSTKLGLDPTNVVAKDASTSKAKIDWACLGGLRFLLACYVMFMHIGSAESWGKVNNLRGFPWHVHVFFTLGGYSMASPMNPTIQKKFSYFKAKMWSMYPMYLFSLLFGLINLLVVCRPATFRPTFHWNAQPDDLVLEDGSPAPLFCEGTPATPSSYWGSLFSTIVVYLFGLAVTPTWFFNWWLGYYLWFSSIYYQCLAFYPITYNALFNRARNKIRLLIKIIVALMICNAAILVGAWFAFRGGSSFDNADEDVEARNHSIAILSFYLFGPFWALYFVIGAVAAFLYDAYRPAERHNARRWGWVADGCSVILITFSLAYVCQGKSTYTSNPGLEMYMRPEEANQWTDTAATNRIWDAGNARMFCPLTTLWIFALSTGQGWTAQFFRWDFLSATLSPHAYNCFLFHQVVAQWYFAATRFGSFWNWWNYRKKMYWFSPAPCPVQWYEYFFVVVLVVFFSHAMNSIQSATGELLWKLWVQVKGEEKIEGVDDEDIAKLLLGIIEGLTGIEPKLEFTLEDCGLASIAVPALVASLNKAFSKKKLDCTITAADLVSAETIADIADAIEAAKRLADQQGV